MGNQFSTDVKSKTTAVADAGQGSRLESREQDKPFVVRCCRAGPGSTEPLGGPRAARKIQRGCQRGHPRPGPRARQGRPRCTPCGVTTKSRGSLSAGGATRPGHGKRRRGPGPGPRPPHRPALAPQPASHLPRSRPLPPTHHGNRPRPAGAFVAPGRGARARAACSPPRGGWMDPPPPSGVCERARTGFLVSKSSFRWPVLVPAARTVAMLPSVSAGFASFFNRSSRQTAKRLLARWTLLKAGESAVGCWDVAVWTCG